MAVRAQRLSVINCVFAVVGQLFLVVHFQVRSLILLTEKWCGLSASLAFARSAKQHNGHHIRISVEGNDCNHLSASNLRCRSQPQGPCCG